MTLPWLLVYAIFSAAVEAQIQLLNTSSTNSSLTTCVEVLNQDVTCTGVLARLGRYSINGMPIFLNSTDISGLCTSTCLSSLNTWERRVAGACGSAWWPKGDGSSYVPAALVEQYVEIYESVCLDNSAGQNCNLVLGSALGVNPLNQMVTSTPTTTIGCNGCYLSLLKTQLEMPMASSSADAALLSTLTSLCKSTGFSLTPAPTATTFTSPAPSSTAPAGCNGTTYTIKSSDTCQSISTSQGISTFDLTQANGLSNLCYLFPTLGTVCIPTALKCETYIVKTGDTCQSIQLQFSIMFSQVVAWNWGLGTACQNLASYVGYAICVSNPGGNWVDPNPPTTTTGVTTSYTFTNYPLTAMSLLPTVTYIPASYNESTGVSWYAEGTRLDCASYIQAPFYSNYTGNITSSSCADAAAQYDASLADFVLWNPSLDDSDSCELVDGLQYCAQVYNVTAQDITSYCTQWATAPSGYDCYMLSASYGVDIDAFVSWNPSLVNSNCTGYQMGTSYCVAVNGYQQPGITPNCNKFVVPNDTNWADLPCQILETENGISHARFVAWNPAVQQNCTGLFPGYAYCVSIPNYKPTYTSTTPLPTTLSTTDSTYLGGAFTPAPAVLDISTTASGSSTTTGTKTRTTGTVSSASQTAKGQSTTAVSSSSTSRGK